ncbi:DivIVA domain-containing protein [Luteimicrobium sp. NPDC057192]|uniref:DivIVA domain-containing protein n=1 Tax=Luteimicrobium sp. NPDC057192 TaxID=3346042 RepID=UPI0036251F91
MITAEDVRSRKFSTTKFREGYDIEEVDGYLDEIGQTLTSLEGGAAPTAPGLIGPEDVLAKVFDTVKFREGYAIDEVDDLLDVVVQTLQEHKARALATGAQPVVAAAQPTGSQPAVPVTTGAQPSVQALRDHLESGSPAGLSPAAAVRALDTGASVSPTPPLPPDPEAAALGTRVLISQLQIATIRTQGNDGLSVVTPDGTVLRVVGVDASPQGVTLRTA